MACKGLVIARPLVFPVGVNVPSFVQVSSLSAR